MNIFFSLIFLTLILFPAFAETLRNSIDGNGLVCRRTDLYFSRPYYFVFDNGRVLGPWVTNDTPERIRTLPESNYRTRNATITWFRNILSKDTLQLQTTVEKGNNFFYDCEIMDLVQVEMVIQEKEEKRKRGKY